MQDRLDANYKNLERVNSWIANADNKASIIFAFNGILLIYLLTNVSQVKTIISARCLGFIELLMCLFLLLYAFFLFISVYKSFNVIFPDIKERLPSPFFFGTIANIKLEEFKETMRTLDDTKIEEELINQTYINSKIATKKFKNLQSSVKALSLSLIFWFISLFLIFVLS